MTHLRLAPLDLADIDWDALDAFDDRVVYQTKAWVSFVASSQRGEPVVAAVRSGKETVGYFTGLVVRRSGIRMLGSPFPGWTTQYMGFNLRDSVSRRDALEALLSFAFGTLRCLHVEVADRALSVDDVSSLGLAYSRLPTFTLDLTPDEDALLAGMTSACRRNIRKAERLGVVVEESTDLGFADEYYEQLRDVFGRQSLVPTYGVERVRTLIRHLQPTERLLLLRARDEHGQCIATAIFPAMNKAMYFWGGASWRQYQELRPNEALVWHAIRYWRQRGVREMDFGGGGGSYKRKYGTSELVVPLVRRSRYRSLESMRNVAKSAVALRQRALGRVVSKRSSSARSLPADE